MFRLRGTPARGGHSIHGPAAPTCSFYVSDIARSRSTLLFEVDALTEGRLHLALQRPANG
jgi:hypothetical protein